MTHSKFWKEISDDCEDVTEAEDCVDALEWDTKNNAAKKPPPVYLYIVMQLCQKESLRVWLRNTSETRSRVKALFMFNEICNGVEYVHSQGLIHRYVVHTMLKIQYFPSLRFYVKSILENVKVQKMPF